MKRMKKYINAMYRPAFIALVIGLSIFSLSLIHLAVLLRADILAGESDIIYRYPPLIEHISMPLYILIPVTLGIDLNEKSKNR